jgi:hypothetical protein
MVMVKNFLKAIVTVAVTQVIASCVSSDVNCLTINQCSADVVSAFSEECKLYRNDLPLHMNPNKRPIHFDQCDFARYHLPTW